MAFFLLLRTLGLLALMMAVATTTTRVRANFQATQLSMAHATFYGDETAQSTSGGACGYGSQYGTNTAALSQALYDDGYGCGQCYQLQCTGSTGCCRGNPTVTITATNLCPPNFAEASDNGGWCNPPRDHFDMALPAFQQIVCDITVGIVPVMYRRVPCPVTGGIQFLTQGNAYWLLVYVLNVGGGGDIYQMWVKGCETDWISMSHNWGASYQAFEALGGQTLSFKIQSYTTQETLILNDVFPSDWSLGLTYEANGNFQ